VLFRFLRCLRFVDLETGEQIDNYPLPGSGHGLAWHPHGKLLAVTGLDAQHLCFIFNTETHEQHALLTGHTHHVTQCAFSHGGNVLTTTGYDNTTILWDTASGRPQVRIAGQFRQIGAGDRGIFYGRADGTVGIWEVATGSECRTIHAPSEVHYGPWCVDVHPNGRLMATASEDGCRLWDLVDGRELGLLPVGNSRTALFLPSGDLITYGEFGLQRWPVKQSNAATSMQIGPPIFLTDMKGPPNYSNAKLSRDGHRLAAVISAGRAIVLDPSHPDEHVICGPHLGLAYITLSPDGKWLVTGTQHGTGVKVWDAATGKCVKEIAGGHYGLAAFSLDCRTLVTWSTGHPRQGWDVGTWQTKELADDRWDLSAGSRDGKIIAASTAAGILLKDARTDKELATLTPSEILPVSSLCFSPDDQQLIVSCNNYHAVQVWNLQDIRRQLREMDLDWDHDVPPVKPSELSGSDLTITISEK
jgi:WD40 repeat protein